MPNASCNIVGKMAEGTDKNVVSLSFPLNLSIHVSYALNRHLDQFDNNIVEETRTRMHSHIVAIANCDIS